MIEIKTVQSFDELKKLYAKENIEFSEFCMEITAIDGEEQVGSCLFMLKPDGIYIKSIEPQDDLSLADGVLRSALHVAVFHNVNAAFYEETAPFKILKKLGFILSEKDKMLNINKLFESCCSCKKQ